MNPRRSNERNERSAATSKRAARPAKQAGRAREDEERRLMGTTAKEVAAEQGLPETPSRDHERERRMTRPKSPQ